MEESGCNAEMPIDTSCYSRGWRSWTTMQLPICTVLEDSNVNADIVTESVKDESSVPLTESLRNHSACVGNYSLDDWIEFMTFPTDVFNYAVCGLPRNFNSQAHEHRRQTVTDMEQVPVPVTEEANPIKKKRYRTTFSKEQKQKMNEYATSLGWKISREEGDAVQNFCDEISVPRKVFCQWVHNNKIKKPKNAP